MLSSSVQGCIHSVSWKGLFAASPPIIEKVPLLAERAAVGRKSNLLHSLLPYPIDSSFNYGVKIVFLYGFPFRFQLKSVCNRTNKQGMP
jgi:hypothetical protein